jgi:hypothetical protein
MAGMAVAAFPASLSLNARLFQRGTTCTVTAGEETPQYVLVTLRCGKAANSR